MSRKALARAMGQSADALALMPLLANDTTATLQLLIFEQLLSLSGYKAL